MSVTASHDACTRMEEGNVTNDLNYLFPNKMEEGGLKIDCEASLRTFFPCKWYHAEACF